MQYNYFCPGKSGKYLIRDMFWYNNKTHSLFCCGELPMYMVMSDPNGNFDWFWEDDNTGNLVQSSYKVDGDIILNHDYSETWYPVPTNGVYSIKKLLKNTDIKASSTCKGLFHKCFQRALDTDIITNPLVMLGYGGVLGSSKLGKLLRNHLPNLENIPVDWCVDELCKRKSIVTHKSDIRELARNFFIGNGHLSYKDPNVLKTDTTEKYVQQVTKIINANRKFEEDIISCLDYYNIPYEIFDLDKDDYASTFNLEKAFSKADDPHPQFYEFIESRDIIEGWIDDYVAEYPYVC